jgi:hypothetical protein
MPSGDRWNIEITDDCLKWFAALEEGQQDALRADIEILEQIGPFLGRPYVDSIKGSKYSNMKEPRTMHARRHIGAFLRSIRGGRQSC